MNINNENKEYELINLKFEYPGMKGGVTWAVISELSMDELMEKYGDELLKYSPVILLSVEQGEAFKEFHRNEHKHDMREARTKLPVNYNEELHEFLGLITTSNVTEDDAINKYDLELLRESIDSLTAVQQRRIKLYFFEGLTFREIAAREGVSTKNVYKSVQEAMKKIKKFWE